MTLVVTLLSPIAQIITSLVITPDFFENAKSAAVQLEYMSAADAESFFTLKNYIIQGVIYAPIMGVITAVIAALAARKSKQ